MILLTSSACIYGNGSACYSAGDAYIKQVKLDKMLENFEKHHKELYLGYIGAVVAIVDKKQISFPIYRRKEDLIKTECDSQGARIMFQRDF